MSPEQRDALARVIDPQAWKLHDVKGMHQRPDAQDLLVLDSRITAERIDESGLMASFDWTPREYRKAIERVKERTSRTGKCYSVEDGLDGYFMHDPKCHHWPSGATGGSGCI